MAETKETTIKKTTTKKAVKEEVKVDVEVKTETPKTTKKASSKKELPTRELNRVEKRFKEEVTPSLMKKFEYKNLNEVPKLSKIVINIGVGDAISDKKRLDEAVEELALISGQKPVITKAKKSIATFKLREGEPIGCKVTLRGKRMYEFFDKLVTIALPRVRDFRGVNKNAFDGRGNYTLGVKEQLIFPEIDYDKVGKIRGMDIVIVTTSKTDEESYALLKELGMPFQR